MKLPDNTKPFVALAMVLSLSTAAAARNHQDAAEAANGPSADYPIIVGKPYTVDGVTFTPTDTMNYDATGYAISGAEGGNGVTAAHHTLPLPCYVEVTALTTGKTILVRLERRGPMTSNNLIALSPEASAQLGVNPRVTTPVRVRRVNPPELDRALLRSGQRAPDRMDTPDGLLTVLKRKLDGSFRPGTQPLPSRVAASATPSPQPMSAKPAISKPTMSKPGYHKPAMAMPKPAPILDEPQQPQPEQAIYAAPNNNDQATSENGGLFVQIAAFSSKARAVAVARRAGASLAGAGNIWRVRMGPFNSREDAQAMLANAKAAGYSDARIQSAK